jgi:hypothetical protein
MGGGVPRGCKDDIVDATAAIAACWYSLLPLLLLLLALLLLLQADMAEGMWVTDEFESEDYERGNMEKAWGMYLWDK